MTTDGPAPGALPDVLEIHDLCVDFATPKGPVHALRNVAISVPRGGILGVVGESGSGKSTLALAVMGLLPATAEIAGRLTFRGENLGTLSPAAFRPLRGSRLAMVFQDPMTSLNPVRAIGRQMTDTLYRNRDTSTAEKRRLAANLLRRVGLPDAQSQLDRYPHQFSGGMRQRIAIAMALLQRPELLIADEPTTALDVSLEAQILQLLRDLRLEFNTSILFISHNLGAVAEICDSVAVLYAGEIVERGPVAEILLRPRHPYTQALIACDPARIAKASRSLPVIPGDVPDLTAEPKACIFAPRCPKVFATCWSERPPAVAVDETHEARCHLLASSEKGLRA